MNIDYKKCSNDTDIGTLDEFDENSNILYIVYLNNGKVSYFCYDVDTMIELFKNNSDVLIPDAENFDIIVITCQEVLRENKKIHFGDN